ncbi:MAG: hypothetical protein ABI824_14215 [Acidobacteriota bacterium]
MDQRYEFSFISSNLERGVCYYYKRQAPIGSSNPSGEISVINEGNDNHPDWYFRIHDGMKLLHLDRHFLTADAADAAAIECSLTMPKGLRLRRYEWYSGKEAYTVDGLADYDIDVTFLGFESGGWRYQVKGTGQGAGWSKPWATLEDAFAAFQSNPPTAIIVHQIQLPEGHTVYRAYGYTDCEVLVIERTPGCWYLRTMMDNGLVIENHDSAWTCPLDALTH